MIWGCAKRWTQVRKEKPVDDAGDDATSGLALAVGAHGRDVDQLEARVRAAIDHKDLQDDVHSAWRQQCVPRALVPRRPA